MNCGIRRILQFKDLVQLGPIQIIDEGGIDVTTQCQYSWSCDSVCWTDWVDYSTYTNIAKNLEDEMFLRVLLFGSFNRISINGAFTKCYSIVIDSGNPFAVSLCGGENAFNPYTDLDCALLLQQQMADSIICTFGIPIYYFRVAPDTTTADYTFKEYVLHNVVDVKKIQLMIPDGVMPSSNPKFTALDFDWEVDWDVEIGKTQFSTAFGDRAFPKMRDFIYIPMMGRMWDVNTAYDEKNESLMWQSTTWKLSLVKHEDKTNITTPQEMDNLIDGWLTNRYEDTFGKIEDLEQERLSGTSQIDSPHYSATNLTDISMEDSIRHKYSKSEVSVVDYQYNHHSNVVARSIYKFKTPGATVTYQRGYCGTDGTLSFIIQTQGMPTDGQNIVVVGPVEISMTFDKDHYVLKFNGMTANIKSFSTNLVIVRWNKQNYTTSLDVYEYTHQQGVAKYMLRPEMYWFNETPVVSLTSEYNLDFEASGLRECYIQPYPCMMTNIKLYNKDLGLQESITESIKYTTQHPACVISDVVRHFTAGHGYEVN